MRNPCFDGKEKSHAIEGTISGLRSRGTSRVDTPGKGRNILLLNQGKFVSVMSAEENYYELDAADPARQRHIRTERERARKLRKTPWWATLINKGICHYCQGTVPAAELTMDHLVPLARGGKSSRGNIVPACRDCNRKKQLITPAESILRTLNSKEH